jgi:intraflagellar transport protein 122
MSERILCLSFSSTRHRNKEYVLYAGTWEKNLYILELSNYTIIDCKKLYSDPISFSLFKDDYFLLGSNNNEVNFYTKEGIHITSITENINDWVMAIKPSNKYNSFVVCTNDGRVLDYQINFQIVHGIYNEKYVFRQNLMDIIIHNLSTNTKSKIKCKKYIRKLAVYKDLVAALTSDKVLVYQLNEEETSKSPKYVIPWEGDLNLILISSSHLFICLDNRLISYDLEQQSSSPSKEWTFEAELKYLRVIGGAKKREALIAGLKNGEIYMIYVDNQFPVLLYQHDIPIRSLDVNSNRKKLAIVDENHDLLVVDIATKNILWKDEKAKSVAFNSEIEDMISFWYDGYVYIKTSNFPSTSEKMNGVIVGFRGTKVFLLQSQNNISVLDISHSTTIMKYTEKKDFAESYKVACLGATNQEWMYLGFEALLNFDFIVAVNCFKKLQDIRLINLVFKIENDRKEKLFSDEVLKGDVLCNLGEYNKAAEMYIKGGNPEKAVEMYSLLKMWSEAMEIKKKYLVGKDTDMTDGILLQQADWLSENGKYAEAADLYLLLGKKKRAIEIYGEKGMLDKLIDICRSLNKDDGSDFISLCGFYFRKHKHYQFATEAYLKLGDTKALVLMNIELGRWEEAFLLAQQNKKLLEYVYLQYADHLISKDKFKEAQSAYKKAGRVDLSMKLLQKLIDNAVYEKRHKDASALFIQYSFDALSLVKDYQSVEKSEMAKIKDFKDSCKLADIFNAFDIVYKYIEEPFSSDLLTIDNYGLFNTCKYLVNEVTNMKTSKDQIKNITPSYVFYALAFLSKQFEAYKTARFSFEKLNTLKFPQNWQSKIDFEIMSIRSKPYMDKDTNMPVCFRCLNTNPLINIKGDKCTTCSAGFIRSPISQEILPLIEFKPAEGIQDDQAIEIIKSSAISKFQKPSNQGTQGNYSNSSTGTNVLVIQQDDNNDDLFGMRLVEWCESKVSNEDYGIFQVDESILRSLNETEVFIIDLRSLCKSIPVKFYKNRMKDIFITMCKFCYRFFRTEEYENLYLKNENSCPVCKYSEEKERSEEGSKFL